MSVTWPARARHGGAGEDSQHTKGPQSARRWRDVVGQGRELDPSRGGEARHSGGRSPRPVCLCQAVGVSRPGLRLPPRPFLCPQLSPSVENPQGPLCTGRWEELRRLLRVSHSPTPHGGRIPSGGSAAGGSSAPWGGSPARPCSEGMVTSGPGDLHGKDRNRSEQRRIRGLARVSPLLPRVKPWLCRLFPVCSQPHLPGRSPVLSA